MAHLPAIVMTGIFALAACGPTSGPPSAGTDAGEWHEFNGSWNGSGRRHTIPLGGDRRASLIDLSGSMLLAGRSRPGVGFRAEVIALGDSETGIVGRAVWTDQNGDQIFSELHGNGTAPGDRIAATFLGGTGRYAGADGGYEFKWQYVLEAEDGTVQGRTIDLKGRVRVGQPSSTPPAEVKP